ncbi:MAG: TRAP transporter small permease subunit [Alphaproteobacteria bacterium]
MRGIAAFIRLVEAANDRMGRAASWLALATVVICATVVILRYVFSIGLIWLQDLYVWTHAAVFMLGAAFALMRNGHVRVDIYYASMSPRGQAWVEILGFFTCLVPWIGVLAWLGWPYVAASWELGEGSAQVGGMPGLFVLKTVILVFCAAIFLQGLAGVARAFLLLAGYRGIPAPPAQA